jgi:glucosamine-6-phosphate deaminase
MTDVRNNLLRRPDRKVGAFLIEPTPLHTLRVDSLAIEVFEDRAALSLAAAAAAARCLKNLATQYDEVRVLFATGDSQKDALRFLSSMADLPWSKVVGFHVDEYLKFSGEHPGSLPSGYSTRRYIREWLTSKVPLRQFYEITPDREDPEKTCREYAEMLRAHSPQICLLGIGDNGHLAFNNPADADFQDPIDVKVVTLDLECRQQQADLGSFPTVDDVPQRAITLTIPCLLRVPTLILSVPGEKKARIVKRTISEAVSPVVPATILRTHPNATIYLDRSSAGELRL